MRLGLRRWARRLHLILALSAGIILALSGLTGSALVYRAELEALIDPTMPRSAYDVDPAALDAAIEQAAARYGQAALRYIYLPRWPGQPLEIWILTDEAERILLFDPGTGKALRDADRHAGLFGTLARLHIELLAGETGHTILGFAGLASLIVLVTGLWLAWPGWRKCQLIVRLRLRRHAIARWRDLHRVFGLASLPLLLIAVTTGVALVFGGVAADLLTGAFSGGRGPVLAKEARILPGPPLATSKLVAHAAAALPGATPTRFALPIERGRPALVRLRHPDSTHINGMSFIAVHPQSGRILSIRDESEATGGRHLLDIRYPLHTGTYLGNTGRALAFGAGIVPSLLLVTGLLYWRRRRAARRLRTQGSRRE